jgi:hypothetical protein
MSAQKESIWVILSGLGGLATVLYVLHTWPPHPPSPSLSLNGAQQPPRSHAQANEAAKAGKDANDSKDPKDGVGAESAGDERQPKRSSQVQVLRPPRSARAAPDLPTEFMLGDGEQKVLLSGQASVGIQFNQIGEERFLTLRINSSGGSANHAILSTGARFPFRQGGSEYYVSVLRFDYTARTALLRVDLAK